MASREQLVEINKARAGDANAQISLAKRYLSGEPGLAKSDATALLWLKRAAQHGSLDACVLIGSYITLETAQNSANPALLLPFYKQAFLAGIDAAGLTLAQLILLQSERQADLQADAKTILENLASRNVSKAQWLLATAFDLDHSPNNRQNQELTTSDYDSNFPNSSSEINEKKLMEWTIGAAVGGISEARFLLAESAWANNNHQAFLKWASPEAELISQQYGVKRSRANFTLTETQRLQGFKMELLYRCAASLCHVDAREAYKAVRYLEIAALEGHSLAQLTLGQWLAKMDSETFVIPIRPKRASFERAVKLLAAAGSQGLANAWYALSQIYLQAEFVGRNLVKAEHFLTCAAELDHCKAQLELGTREWRMRHKSMGSDLDAALWLQKASRQGCVKAEAMLQKVAPRSGESVWAMEIHPLLTVQTKKADPFIVARIELAALVGLSKLEALWLDIHDADRGHCLVVDVTKHARNTKRRLISIFKDEERQVIDRMKVLFYGIETSEDGPEGDYRRRIYRLNKLI